MMFVNTFLVVLIAGVLLSTPLVSKADDENDALEDAINEINDIVEEKGLSEDDRKAKITAVTKKLSKAMDSFDLTPEEAKKLSGPLSMWTSDLKKRLEELHAKNGEVSPDDLIRAIDESMASRPDLGQEVGTILKSKDQKKVKQFFSNMKSSAKRLGHKLKEKVKSGWKKTKNFLRIRRGVFSTIGNGISRIIDATFSILDLLVFNPIVAVVSIPFKGFGYAGDLLDTLTIAAAVRIYDYLFKFYGDPEYKKNMNEHVKGVLGERRVEMLEDLTHKLKLN